MSLRLVIRIVLAVVALGLIIAIPSYWHTETVPTYQGWVEADTIYVSPDESGRILTLAVKEGDHVNKGAGLFELDDDLQRADLLVADAAVENAQAAYDRASELLKRNAGTQATYDAARAALRTAQAQRNAALTRLARRRVASPVAGSVQQVYFRVGEMVSAGKPVVAILPPANVKLRFFVPERVLPDIALGDVVDVQCDGCTLGLKAHISFISRSAEYTPPVIYSLEERQKLVFLVEALPERPKLLRVGQPVSITLRSRGHHP